MQYHTANESDTVLYVSTGNEETVLDENGHGVPADADYDADLDEKHEEELEEDDPTKIQDSEDLDGKHQIYLAYFYYVITGICIALYCTSSSFDCAEGMVLMFCCCCCFLKLRIVQHI